jgi:hypothetical protein
MRSLLLALALLPGAAAMGRYVPEGCTVTPGGHLDPARVTERPADE